MEQEANMKARSWPVAATIAAMVGAQSDVHGLNPPSASDGPIKLLACIVSPNGMLEAQVESQSEDAMSCNIRCNYELGEKMFSHTFDVTIPARFQGRVGRFDTSTARAGSYPGEVGTCEKVSR
jgi:hypothetical protein